MANTGWPPDPDDDEQLAAQPLGPLGPIGSGDQATPNGAGAAPQQSPLPQPLQGGPYGTPPMSYDAQNAYKQSMQQMPQAPSPSVWRRVLAGALGGAAGFANVNAGRPGGPTQPIDASGAVGAIMGTTDYQRKLKAWQLGEQQKEKAAELERNQNKDILNAYETQDRLKTNAAIRGDTVANRANSQIETFQKNNPIPEDEATQQFQLGGQPSYPGGPPTVNPPWGHDELKLRDDPNGPNPNTEQPGGPTAAGEPVTAQQSQLGLDSLPPFGAAPQLPVQVQGMNPGYVQNTTAGMRGMPQMTGYAETPAHAAAALAAAKAAEANIGKVQMTSELANQLQKANMFNPFPIGGYVDKETINKYIEEIAKQQTTAKPGSPEWDIAKFAQGLGKVGPNGEGDPNQLSQKEIDAYRQEVATSKLDPQMEAARLQNAQVLASIHKMQLAEQPTNDDINMWADSMLNHRMSPSQVSQLTGRSGGGSIRSAIISAGMRKDPNFDFERAQSDYQFTTTPQFQNNVRYMDSVQKSIPTLIASAQQYGNQHMKFTNGLINMTQAQLQNPQLADFRSRALLVSDEVAKILSGAGSGGATSDLKLKQSQDLINTSDDPAVIAAALGAIQDLIGKRRQSLTLGTSYQNFGSAGEESSIPFGNGQKLPEDIGQQIFSAAGSDPARAREIAKLRGWVPGK